MSALADVLDPVRGLFCNLCIIRARPRSFLLVLSPQFFFSYRTTFLGLGRDSGEVQG